MTQTVLVTGAASGLGNVIAAHLLAEGFQVVLTDVDAARAEAAAVDPRRGRRLSLARSWSDPTYDDTGHQHGRAHQ